MSVDTQIRNGRQAEAKYDRTTAIECFRQALTSDPTNTEAAFHLAYNLEFEGKDDEAMLLLAKLSQGSKVRVNAMVNLAVLYEDIGEYQAAERCLKMVLATNPNHARARLYMKDVQAGRRVQVVQGKVSGPPSGALLETPATDFDLSARARNCLKKLNVRTLGDLLRISESELMAYKNLGDGTLQEIKNLLTLRGLRLGQELEAQRAAAVDDLFNELAESVGVEAAGVLDQPVDELDLSVRARKALSLLGISTIGQLVARTEGELMGIKNFGTTSLDEIKAKLQERGLGLRPLED